jgi:predicted PurR-regulated permease PerM
MKPSHELTAPESLAPSRGSLDLPDQNGPESETVPVALRLSKTALAQIVLIVLGVVAALHFARPVLLPIFIACVAGMTLKPLIRWSSKCHIPPAFSAAVVLLVLVAGVVFGFGQFSRPAMAWVNDAPQHMTALRQRIQKLLPPGARFSAAAAAVSNLGATEAEKKEDQKNAPTVQVRDNHGSASVINWTELFLVGLIETLVLLYLLLASGDLFLQKLVHVMPTLGDKKRAVEISHEIQQNISNYLLSVTLINVGLGVIVSGGLYFMGVPNALMWGIFVAVLNFVPYFGPVAGIALLAAVGLLTFETSLWRALLPPAWYLLLHLLETNLVTPVLLGRRFTLNPVVIFVSLIFWTWLWGTPGALLSLPILVSVKVISDHVPALSSVSEVLSR